MEPLCIAVARYLPKESNYFFRPSDKFYYELDLWETDFEERIETLTKVSDLRYAIERGFDLEKHVMEYVENKPQVPGYLEPILAAFRRYIKFLRTGVGLSDGKHGILDPIMHLGVEDLVDLFCKEVMICLPVGSVPHWDYIALLTARNKHIISGSEFYKICTSPTDYYIEALERINTQERKLRKEKVIKIIEIEN